jgi:hypothetical protein
VLAMQDAAISGRQLDESAVSGLTMRDAAADPFGIFGRLVDVPEQVGLAVATLGQVVSRSA